MNRSLLCGLALVTLTACSGPAFGSNMTSNGSTICDSNRDALAAIDANYTLTNNSNKIIYAAGANDDDCRPEGGESHTLRYRILGGTWATMPTSNGSGPFLASSGTDLTHNSTVGAGERRAKTTGSGSYKAYSKEHTTSASLTYSNDWRDDRTEGQWALDFSNCGDGETYEFQVRWEASDCGYTDITYAARITTASGAGGVVHDWAMDETSGAVGTK